MPSIFRVPSSRVPGESQVGLLASEILAKISATSPSAQQSVRRRRPPRPLVYGSVCSGIEAASVAWKHLGWRPAFFSEIEPFPRAVLQHHYPQVPLHGDFTTIGDDEYESIDLLVGGTPCQSFSVAGLRRGLADDRGNLTLEFVRLADRRRPRWLVWENVPGVLSIDGGRAFGTFLGGLAEVGYGTAYRVLDAQHFGVPQRRRRVFLIGYLGDWRPPAAVLFERESLQWDIEAGGEARKAVTGTLSGRATGGGGLGTDFELSGGVVHAPRISPSLMARDYKGPGSDGTGLGAPLIAFSCKDDGRDAGVIAPTLRSMSSAGGTPNAGGQVAVAIPILGGTRSSPSSITHRTGDGIGHPRSPMFTLTAGKKHAVCVHATQDPIIVKDCSLPIGAKDMGHAVCLTGTVTHTLKGNGFDASEDGTGRGQPIIAFTQNQRDEVRALDVAGALAAEPGMKQQTFVTGPAVRRLTPRECERLQGFPDDYTLVTYRGRAAADGPRYKSLGNSMAVPVMGWLGDRIQMVDGLLQEQWEAASDCPTIH